VEEVRDWMAAQEEGSSHQGFPVLDDHSRLVGVVTRKDLLDLDLELDAIVGDLIRRAPVVIFNDSSAREAADQMARAGVGRLPVVERENPSTVLGIVTRSDLIMVHRDRLHAAHQTTREIGPGSRRRAEDS
jgi:CBS domain-containing protein